tara:strand:- start:1610 stop:2476 length:867 start_codon:yes stop_codon:yes gene_type:complete
MKNKLFEPNTFKLNELMLLGEAFLLENNIENSKKEIEWFVIDKFQLKLQDIKLNNKKNLSEKNKFFFIDFIKRRSQGYPFQYILNKSSFYGYDFFVTEDTLIPRPETELIIDVAKKHGSFDFCLDIGTGSGNLSITLFKEKVVKQVHAIDISEKALLVAEKNKKIHGATEISFEKIDFLNYNFRKKYDLIVANPPYITKKDYKKLPIEIKSYEPKIALTDFEDGLTFYKKISKNLPLILNKNGVLIVEIGLENTKKEIDFIFRKSNFILKWYKDLNNNYRALKVVHSC